MEQTRVLIVSGDAHFVSAITQNWQQSPGAPTYVVAGSEPTVMMPEPLVAIVDGAEAMTRLPAEYALAIAVTGDEALPEPSVGSRLVRVQRDGSWATVASTLAQEAVQRVTELRQAAEIERRQREVERYVALGKLISESRHGLGNALTSLLGNSELVLLETESSGLRPEVRGQLETIHAMSLRIHEIMQRLSSLDMEMQVAEREAAREALRKQSQAVAP